MEDDILRLGLSFLKLIGEYMHYKSIKLQIWRCFNIAALTIAIWFTTANLGHATGAGYMKTIEGVSTLIHILLKYLFIINNKSRIENILDDRSKFWTYKGYQGRIFKRIKTTFTFVKYAQRYLISTMFFVVFMYWLRPYLDENTRFLYDCWIYPDSIVLEAIVLACQYYTLGAAIPIVLGCDFVYFSYTFQYASQLQLLNYELKRVNAETKPERIYEYIKHHQFLISIFKRISSIYFWMLLFHYIVTLATCCCQLYIVILRKAGSQDILASFIYNVALYVEFGYYAFPADILVTELRAISNAVYSSCWYDQDVKIQKSLLVIMMQAQRQRYMSVGGIVEMNVDTFSSVIRKTFSFYTVSRNILNE